MPGRPFSFYILIFHLPAQPTINQKPKAFLKSLSLLLVLNFAIKPVWIFLIDRQMQNIAGAEAYGSYFAVLNLSIVLSFLSDAGLTNMMNQRIADQSGLNYGHYLKIKLVLVAAFVAAPTFRQCRKMPLCQHSCLVKPRLALLCPGMGWFPTLLLYSLIYHAAREAERFVPLHLPKRSGIRSTAKEEGGDRLCANKWDCRSVLL